MKRKDKKMSTFQIFEDFAKLEVRSEEIDILGEKSLYLLQDSPYRFHAIPKPALRMRVW